MTNKKLHVEPGHYYSPIPSQLDIQNALEIARDYSPNGVQLHEDAQLTLAREFATKYPMVLDWLENRCHKFNLMNTWFFGSDAISLTLMLTYIRPQRIVEIGSGHSTALIEEINREWLNDESEILSIDPDSDRAIKLNTTVEILNCPVQEVDLSIFSELSSGDALLIDSSHVLKAGSDIHFIFTKILPILSAGVYVHVHDVFYPFEYPQCWLEQGVSFNEAYALEIVLQNTGKYQVVYWNSFLEQAHTSWFEKEMPLCLNSEHVTGGIWFKLLK